VRGSKGRGPAALQLLLTCPQAAAFPPVCLHKVEVHKILEFVGSTKVKANNFCQLSMRWLWKKVIYKPNRLNKLKKPDRLIKNIKVLSQNGYSMVYRSVFKEEMYITPRPVTFASN